MSVVIFVGAYITDLIVGDPRRIPHPVVIIGKLVTVVEGCIRRGFFGFNEKKSGIILWFVVIIPVYFITWGIVSGCYLIHSVFGLMIAIILSSLTLATRSLYEQSRMVIDALVSGHIEDARKSLSMIVGRDTDNLDDEEIFRAVIETVSENLSDGIVAPMFYLALGGPPLAMAYKAVNTLDSMVGYQNERYGDLGFFSAKMDDIFNWIPARLTGLIIVIVSFTLGYEGRNAWKIMRRDGRNHSSPNSGIPEAATAGALNIQLGGKIQYFGAVTNKPTIGDKMKQTDREAVKKAWVIMFAASLFMAGTCTVLLWVMGR
ncbi:MAG: cobalamin biosynthesis protein CobD [Deltaproteobacteria bacterium]|nr:cobalamin biosynthesis protein CobD [Deltaproteobacteria bacterium]